MRTLTFALAFAALLSALALPAAATDEPPLPAPYCRINHDVFADQYVTYSGFTDVTVGVRFLDGSPVCQVHVVCWGEHFACDLPPLP